MNGWTAHIHKRRNGDKLFLIDDLYTCFYKKETRNIMTTE